MTAHATGWLPRGTVYGTLLNGRTEWSFWASRMTEPPYKAAPRAPVLYIKTANTFAASGAEVGVPAAVDVGATLGLVIGASGKPAGAVLFDDLSLPHASYYRPPIRYRNRDGFLVCGPAASVLPAADLATLEITVRINGSVVQTIDLRALVRDIPTLFDDVRGFMTLQPGDVLLVGTDCRADGTRPQAQAGDRIEISAPGFAPVVHTLAADTAAGATTETP